VEIPVIRFDGYFGNGCFCDPAFATPPIDTILATLLDLKNKITNTNDKVNANLDKPVGSRADGADYTSARAAKLDNLDAQVTSRAKPADVTNAQSAIISAITAAQTSINSHTDTVMAAGPDCSVTPHPGVNLSGCDLYGHSFSTIGDMSYANFAGANLIFAIINGGQNLSHANFAGANLHGASLHGDNLSYASLAGANLSNTLLEGVNFTGADVTGADFTGCLGTPTVTPSVGTFPGCTPWP